MKLKGKDITDPILTSVTMYRIPGDDFAWRAVALKTQGDKVLSQTDICTPNIRAIIEEQFKIFIARQIFGKV